MRIAVCFSGQTRCFKKCAESLTKHLLQPLKPDVFFHFWDTSKMVSPQMAAAWYDSQEPLKWGDLSPHEEENIFKTLDPKLWRIEPQVYFDDSKYRNGCTPTNSRMQAKSFQNVISMYYSIKRANELKCDVEGLFDKEYDVVIRCRTDLKFTGQLNPNDLRDCIRKRCIYVPDVDGYGGLNDQFAFGPSDLMDVYSYCYDYLPIYFDNGGNIHPETILRTTLKDFGIKFKEISIPFTLER